MKQYLVPFLLYLFVGSILDLFGVSEFIIYPVKTLIVLAAVIYYWKEYTEIKFSFDWLAWVVGFGVIVIWIGLDGFYPHAVGSGFDPTVLPPLWMYLSLAVRIFGAVVIAAVVEELVIRSFMIRFIIDPKKWDKVKIGVYSLMSFSITVAFFGFAHNRWLVGIIAGVIFNLWLYYRKDIFSCIQAHASANLFLALYVVSTQNWFFW